MTWIARLVIAGIGLTGAIVIKIQHTKIKSLKAESETKTKSIIRYKNALQATKKANSKVMETEGMSDEDIKDNWYNAHSTDKLQDDSDKT